MTGHKVSRRAGLGLALLLLGGLLPSASFADEPPTQVAWSMQTTAHPVSGQPFTFTPVYPAGFAIPADAVCQYGLRWGDEQSLVKSVFDDSFGSTSISGTKAEGFCDHWTFTLPFSMAGRWEWTYDITDIDYNPLLEGLNERPIFLGTNGAPEWSGITESNLPGVWLSLNKDMRFGQTATATAHPYGGYTQSAEGVTWMATAPGDDSENHAIQGDHHLTFPFVPMTLGNWAVFYSDNGNRDRTTSAGVDPTVRPMTATMAPARSVRLSIARTFHRARYLPFLVSATGFHGRRTCTIAVNGRRILTGCSGRLLFSRLGRRTVTATVTDRYGHRARQAIVIAVIR
jgi:hypothetical protein